MTEINISQLWNARAARPIRLSSCTRHGYRAVHGKLGKIKRGSETVQWWLPFQVLEGVGILVMAGCAQERGGIFARYGRQQGR